MTLIVIPEAKPGRGEQSACLGVGPVLAKRSLPGLLATAGSQKGFGVKGFRGLGA